MRTTGANPANTLADELDTARQLTSLIQQEQAQLIDANIDNLSSIVPQKAMLIARMAELASARHDELAKAGFPAEEASMQKWLDSPASAQINRAAAKQSWAELLELVQSAKEMNRTNGLLIGTHMSRNQAALQVLQGNQQGGAVYGRDGQTSLQTSKRSLIVG